MKIYVVYVTFDNINEAKKIGKILVKNKFAACINIFPNILSIYSWQDKLHSDNECSGIIKTSKTKVSQVIKNILKYHSYDCPSISAFPIERTHKEFQKWIINQTSNKK